MGRRGLGGVEFGEGVGGRRDLNGQFLCCISKVKSMFLDYLDAQSSLVDIIISYHSDHIYYIFSAIDI